MTAYAIMGGTFDPVHLGHTHFALDVLMQTDVDEVCFMPAKLQPFKLDRKMASFEDRANMLRIACEDHPALDVCELENELDGVSYTYRTLDEFKKRVAKDSDVYFITGSDTFTKLDIWAEHEHLLSTNKFIIGVRPGYPIDELDDKRNEFYEKFGTHSIVIHNERLDISSTKIRQVSHEGGCIAGMVASGVAEYIKERQLY